MKLFLFSVLFLLSNSLLAGEGGQDGGGGHICELNSWMPGIYRTADELETTDARSIKILHTYHHDALKAVDSPYTPGVQSVNLLETVSGKNLIVRLRLLREHDHDLGNTLLDVAQLLKHVYLSPTSFAPWGIYRGGLRDCNYENLKAVITSQQNGVIKLHKDSWNLLSIQSKEILLLHETLRLTQIFTDWYAKTNNLLLLYDTMKIYFDQEMTTVVKQRVSLDNWEREIRDQSFNNFTRELRETCGRLKDFAPECHQINYNGYNPEMSKALETLAGKVAGAYPQQVFFLLLRASFIKRVMKNDALYPMSSLFNSIRINHEAYRRNVEKF